MSLPSFVPDALFAVATIQRGMYHLPVVKGGALGRDGLGSNPSPPPVGSWPGYLTSVSLRVLICIMYLSARILLATSKSKHQLKQSGNVFFHITAGASLVSSVAQCCLSVSLFCPLQINFILWLEEEGLRQLLASHPDVTMSRGRGGTMSS